MNQEDVIISFVASNMVVEIRDAWFDYFFIDFSIVCHILKLLHLKIHIDVVKKAVKMMNRKLTSIENFLDL
jgi:hypothetical protein